MSDKAYELYKNGMMLKEIAAQLDLPEGTVRRWKSTYKWDGERSDSKSERSDKKRAEKKTQIDDGTKETLQNEELTPEQQMFCIYYSRTFNATQSYLKAYGCSYDVANAKGPLLVVKDSIRKEIERLKEIKRQQIVAGADDIVELQMRIAFSDMGNYVSFGKTEIEIKNGDMVEINTVDLKESVMTDTQLVRKVSEGKNGISIEVEDRQKAINWLTKYFLMHPDDRYKAEFDRKRAEVNDNTGAEILKNMQTIADILQHPVSNRSIDDFEGVQEDE